MMMRTNTLRKRTRRTNRAAEALERREMLVADLVISELLASNVANLADQDGDFSDWLEIRNTTAASVNLAGWSLTDESGNLTKWTLPNQSLAAGGHLVVFASGKNRATAGSELHTNFKLSGGGEYLALVQPGGAVIATEFSPEFPEQFDDISYGYSPDLATLGYFATPTPGALNSGDQVSNPEQDVVISEIMYHPALASDSEWIELFNRGQVAVNLSGWRFDAGVDYTFPAYTLNAGARVVVAGDLAAFLADYPAVTNVMSSGWNPPGTPAHLRSSLGDGGEGITLVDDAGETIDRVEYAEQGMWGERRRQPASAGTQGWDWFAAHDGGGPSLELINAAITNNEGQNWNASSTSNGSPGTPNSIAATNVRPLIVDAQQFPIIPRPTDAVTVTARLVNESAAGVTGTVFWRIGTGVASDPFTAVAMADDGLHNDGLAGDGVYGATIPATGANNTVIEYYFQASDGVGTPRTWPAPSKDINGADLGQRTNLLYQADASFNPDADWVPGSQPIYRVVMTTAEYNTFAGINRNSFAQMHTTLIAQDGTGFEVRHETGVRIRGNSSRGLNPPPNRFDIPHDRPLEGRVQFGLNVRNPYNQLAANAIFRQAGLQIAEGLPVQYRINGLNGGSWGVPLNGAYVRTEMIDTDFLSEHVSNDPGGNVYRKRRINFNDPRWPYLNDPSGAGYANIGWEKQTNEVENDWTDLNEWMRVMNQTPSGPGYYPAVNAVVDVDQWVSWFALMQLIDSQETNLSNGADDDYEVYAGSLDRRFRLIPHDLDAVMGRNENGNSYAPTANGIFQATIPGGESIPQLNAFFDDPTIVQKYYTALRHHINTTLSPGVLNPLLDQVAGSYTGQAQIDVQARMDAAKTWQAQRNAYVLTLIPSQFTVVSTLPIVGGYRQSTTAGLNLTGQADMSRARSVTVNGQPATLNARAGTWTYSAAGGATTTLIPATSNGWRYLDNGTNQGTAWYGTGFDDSSWLGPQDTQFGINDGDEQTTIVRNITTYFRRTFDVADASQITGLTVNLLADDGAVVYINGQEVLRDNLPAAPAVITSSTFALVNRTSTTTPAENTFVPFNIPASMLVNGTNVIAVELHNVSSTNTDLSFDLSLGATLVGSGSGALNPGINRVQVEAWDELGGAGNVVNSGTLDIWYNDGTVVNVAGTLSGNTTWSPALGPYHVTANATVPAGSTLTIQPGTTVYFDAGRVLTVNGTLIAQGTKYQRLRFTSVPGAALVADIRPELPLTQPKWDGVQLVGSNSPQNIIAYADFEDAQDDGGFGMIGIRNGSQAVVDRVTFNRTHLRMISVVNSSAIIRNSVFPNMFAPGEHPALMTPPLQNGSEHIEGSGGVPDGGWLIIENNTFGTNVGHNDTIDIDSNIVTEGPIVQILNNLFLGTGDEMFDGDGDLLIEGNVFLNVVKDVDNDGTGEANAVTSGETQPAVLSINRNLLVNIDHIVNFKNDSYGYVENNTVVNVSAPRPSLPGDNPPRTLDFSAINYLIPNAADPLNGDPRDWPPGKGTYTAGNVFFGIPQTVFGNVDFMHNDQVEFPFTPQVIEVHNSLVPSAAALANAEGGPQGRVFDYLVGDPRFVNAAAGDYRLGPGSPAIGTGPNGIDMGAFVAAGASISGEPPVQTASTSATLRIGGPGIFSFDWRIDGGAWQPEVVIRAPRDNLDDPAKVRFANLQLNGLSNGPHTVEVRGRNFAGVLQTTPTASKTWTVDTSLSRLLINEVLAHNVAAVNNAGTFPDAIELFNAGAASVNLAGMSLSDDPNNPDKYVFPAGTSLAAGAYLVVYADEASAAPGIHLGFNLDNSGEGVFLYNSPAGGGALVDSIEFGLQVPDLSIGRVGQDQHWALTQPTFGAANTAARTGNPATLKINEWFTSGDVRLVGDYIELYNPDTLPVHLGGLYITDDFASRPDKHQIADLNFAPAGGYAKLTADENASAGLNHLSFRLDNTAAPIALYDANLTQIDKLLYVFQTTDYSQGRNPDGSGTNAFYRLPTPGISNSLASNPAVLAVMDNLRITEINYNPAGTAATEFIELRNIGGAAINLAGVRLAGGIQFTFPSISLNPGQFVVVVEDLSAFRTAYGTTVNVAGQYTGSLSNGGDSIVLQLPDPYEAAILRFDYDDAWYPTTDGGGRSLLIVSQNADYNTWDEQTSWQAGGVVGGSPGRTDADPPPIVLTVNPLSTGDTTPALSGTVNYPAAAVSVTVAGNTYPATNNGNGTWTLADNTISPPLAGGTYDVVVSALDGLGNLGTDVTSGELTIQSGATIVGRHIFYNRSFFDGNNASANAADDAAIDTSKTALLPGQTASFANYTGYSRGINGIMVDIQNLPGPVTDIDFDMKTGNNNSPSGWTELEVGTSVSIRPGAGVGGSTRITLIWADGAITKTWLQVKVLANAQTGLAATDVFYFGNAIGEVGNTSANAIVTAADESLIRLNFTSGFGTVPVTSPYDIDKNRFVQASDAALSRANQTTAFSALRLIAVPTGAGGGGSGSAESSSGAALASLDSGLVDLLAQARRRRR